MASVDYSSGYFCKLAFIESVLLPVLSFVVACWIISLCGFTTAKLFIVVRKIRLQGYNSQPTYFRNGSITAQRSGKPTAVYY